MKDEEGSASSGKNIYLVTLVVAIIVGAVGFYGGIKYKESKTSSFARNLPSDFQGRTGQFNQRGQNSGLRPLSGEILSVDEGSIIVKLPDDSSKIVLLTESSVINITEDGSSEDLSEGTEVVVFGQENSDGSVTAQSIQIGSNIFRRSDEQ